MSRYLTIQNETPIQTIIQMAKSNPAGCVFHCTNANSRNELLMKIRNNTFIWLSKGPLLFDPKTKLNFYAKDKCNVLIVYKDDNDENK